MVFESRIHKINYLFKQNIAHEQEIHYRTKRIRDNENEIKRLIKEEINENGKGSGNCQNNF